jgi:hypothetical protein
MTIRPKLRLPVLAAALAVSLGTAYAAYESTYIPAPANAAANEPVVAPAAASPEQSATAEETTVTTTELPVAVKQERAVVPVSEAQPAPAITVTEPRLTTDQRNQADVIDLLARNPNLSGKIGVVSEDSVVTLTGYTATSGQAWRAGRDARGVQGVKHVVNEIRPRIGAITS